MDFSEMLAANIETFGETVTYKPKTGPDRTFQAVVNRAPPAPIPGAEGVHAAAFRVTVRNHATLGILLSELDLQRDKLSFPAVPGGTAQDWNLRPRLAQSCADGFVLEI